MNDVPQSLRALVIGNYALVRAGLRCLLERLPFIDTTEECAGSEALEVVRQSSFDMFVFELEHAHTGWTSILGQVRNETPNGRIVTVTDSPASDHLRALYAAGAVAVLLKGQSAETFEAAIQTAAKGDIWVHRSTLVSVLEMRPQNNSWESVERRKLSTLTKREHEIIHTIGKGYRNKQIASELCLSEATVRHYLTSIFSKLGVSDRLELLIYCQKHRLLNQPAEVQSELSMNVK